MVYNFFITKILYFNYNIFKLNICISDPGDSGETVKQQDIG